MIFIGANWEKENLNVQVRSKLDGKFVKLSEGFTHYEFPERINPMLIQFLMEEGEDE